MIQSVKTKASDWAGLFGVTAGLALSSIACNERLPSTSGVETANFELPVQSVNMVPGFEGRHKITLSFNFGTNAEFVSQAKNTMVVLDSSLRGNCKPASAEGLMPESVDGAGRRVGYCVSFLSSRSDLRPANFNARATVISSANPVLKLTIAENPSPPPPPGGEMSLAID